uniref:PDZ domain-containing protein n=1 Tax=Parastrongyloides trichosuri TaxID=131310 RepID=A0A0N4ZW90_PARTI
MIIKLFCGPVWGFRFQFDEINKLVTVNEVEPYGEAFEKGLRIGDQIISINGKRYKKLIDFCNELYNSCDYLELEILKFNLPYHQELTVEIPKKQIYFEPIIPSNSTVSSCCSTDMEILKHLNTLKATLRQNILPSSDSSIPENNEKYYTNWPEERKEQIVNGISSGGVIDKTDVDIDKGNERNGFKGDPRNNNITNNTSINTTSSVNSNYPSSILQEDLNMLHTVNNIPPPPPPPMLFPKQSNNSDTKHWEIPSEVSNVGKAEGIVEVPVKQTVSNLKKQITGKLQMKTPTGAVVVEAPKVHTKCLVSEGLKCLDSPTNQNNIIKEEIRARSLTPMSFYNNISSNPGNTTSIGKYSESTSNLTDDLDKTCTIRKLRSQLTSPSIQKAKLYNSTYDLTSGNNEQINDFNYVSENNIPFNDNAKSYMKSTENLSVASHKSIYDNNMNNNIEVPDTTNQFSLKSLTKGSREKYDLVDDKNDNVTLNDAGKHSFDTNNLNSLSTSFNTYTNITDKNNTNIPNAFNNIQKPYTGINATPEQKYEFGTSFSGDNFKEQTDMCKSYDSSRLSQLIDQTNSFITKLNDFNLPPNCRSASAVPFASSFGKFTDKNSCAENMSSQNYSTMRVNGEAKDHASSWYKNMYKKLHKIEGEEESILKYHQVREQSPAHISQRAYTPSLRGTKVEYNSPDEKYIGLQRSKSATRFQPTYTSVGYDNFNSQTIDRKLSSSRQNLSQSRVSLAPGNPSDPNEALESMKTKHFHLPSFRLNYKECNDLSNPLYCHNTSNCLIHNDKNTERLWQYLCSIPMNDYKTTNVPSSNSFQINSNTKNNTTISDRVKICKKLDETVESLQRLVDILDFSQTSNNMLSSVITKSKSTSDIARNNLLSNDLKMINNNDIYLKLLQNSNQILSRGINELKRQQVNHVIQQQKAEKLSEELNQQQNRRHGYIPSATPSLQNNFDRFDYLMKDFNSPSVDRMNINQNEYKTATAIYDFNGKGNRELSLNKGDVVKVHKFIDDNWSEGERNGKIGMFPSSYVKMNECATPFNQQKLISVYPFFARNKNELSLKNNEIITKTREIDANWIEGVNQHGVVGIFPSNYVKPFDDINGGDSDYQYVNNNSKTIENNRSSSVIIPDRPKTPKFIANVTTQPQPQFAQMSRVHDNELIDKSTQPIQKKQMNFIPRIQDWKNRHERDGFGGSAQIIPRNSIVYRAVYSYQAQIDGELDLEPNDILFVVEALPDDYVIGALLRTGQFGVVPSGTIVKH